MRILKIQSVLGPPVVLMSRKPNGQKTGIYEHPEIRRDFAFAHGNNHFCLPAGTSNGHLLIFMCENLMMLVNARFLPVWCSAHHYPVVVLLPFALKKVFDAASSTVSGVIKALLPFCIL